MKFVYVGAAMFLVSLSLQLFHEQGWIAAIVLGLLSAVGVWYYPIVIKKSRAGAIEKELPSALRLAAARIEMGVDYDAAVFSHGFGALSEELMRAQRDAETIPVPEAILAMAARTESKWMRRACLMLVDCYEKGSSPDHLQGLAEEIEDNQLQLAREYAGTLSTVAMVFIAVSALFPALFQAYVIVGSRFLSVTVTPMEALVVPAVVFPLADMAVLAFARWRKPWAL